MNKLITATALLAMSLGATASWANLVTNGNFESGGFAAGDNVNADTGPFGQWLATGGWTISSGQAANTSSFAENPNYNYIMMQGIDLSGFSSAFDAVLSFDYVYEGGFSGLDGRGVRLFGMDAGDTVYKYFTSTTFDSVADDALFSQELATTGNPTSAFSGFTSLAFTIDPSQYKALLLVFTFGGSPTSGELRAVDNVELSGPTAVPEPGTLALLGLGLAGLGLSRRRMAA